MITKIISLFIENKRRLLNKQDLDEAMDEVEIVNELNIEQMVNENKCPTKIVSWFRCVGHADLRDNLRIQKPYDFRLRTRSEVQF